MVCGIADINETGRTYQISGRLKLQATALSFVYGVKIYSSSLPYLIAVLNISLTSFEGSLSISVTTTLATSPAMNPGKIA